LQAGCTCNVQLEPIPKLDKTGTEGMITSVNRPT
jgi:hypothetical protein